MKAWRKIVLDAVERVAQGGLGLREVTISLPLRSDAAAYRRRVVAETLGRLEALQPSPYAGVPGLHAARWMLLHSAGDSSVPGPLLCSLVFEGDVDDMLFTVVERTGPHLDALLSHCDGAPSSAEARVRVEYLKCHRLESGYFFSDHRTRTLNEITEALRVKEAFESFYAANQTRAVPELRRRFAEFCAGNWPQGDGLPVGQANELSRPFERRRDQEEAWTRRAVELTSRLQQRSVRKARETMPSARPLRVAHAKHHGCVRARFIVDADLGYQYQHGVFAPGRELEAVIRFSNTSHAVRPDYEPDGRGVAIKLLNVDGLGEPLVPGIPDGVPNAGITQDFLMISSPAFFAKDIRDFTIFRSILDDGGMLERAPRLAAYFMSRPHELAVLARTMLRPVGHPLKVVYHSVTPSLLGPHQAIKYSLQLKPDQDLGRSSWELSDQNFLRTALQRTLHPDSRRTVELEFFLHVPGDHPLPVEDSSLSWEGRGITRVRAATVVIEAQDFTSPAALEACERCIFTPWHTLAQHKPLGSLNRARLAIYRASSMGRAPEGDAEAVSGEVPVRAAE